MLNIIKNKYYILISDEKFSEILTGSVWALLAQITATFFGMVTSIIVARSYGADVLGIIAMLESVLIIYNIVTVCGTDTNHGQKPF